MNIKFLITILFVFLFGCFANNGNVIIVDKSINRPFDNTVKVKKYVRNEKKAVSNKKTAKVYRVSSSIPVKAGLLKGFSSGSKRFGITFNTKSGQKVRAILDGKVVYSGDRMKSHGNMIIIKHKRGYYSSYTQNSTLKVTDGDMVKKGQVIAITGSKPFYFAMKKFSSPINPIKYLK